MWSAFRLRESPMSVRDSLTSHRVTWTPHSPLDLSSHTSSSTGSCLNGTSDQSGIASALGKHHYLATPVSIGHPLPNDREQLPFLPSNIHPAYPRPVNLTTGARLLASSGSDYTDHYTAELSRQSSAKSIDNLVRPIQQHPPNVISCGKGHENRFAISHLCPIVQSPTYYQQPPSFTDPPVTRPCDTSSPVHPRFCDRSPLSTYAVNSASPLSSCCGGSPSPVPWLIYSPANDHVMNTDDSGYISSPGSSVKHSSYQSVSQNSSYTQIGIDDSVHDMFQNICDNKENASPLGSSSQHQTCRSHQDAPCVVQTPSSCRVAAAAKGTDYLYITSSGGATKVTIPEKRSRKQKREENTHQCPVCGERLASRGNLNVHLRRHTGQKPYACDFCQKRFAQRSSLRTHIRTHTGERPYACTVCPQTFRDYSTFTKHYRIHSGQQPYQCDICGKAFTQAGNMVRHRAIHNKKS